LLKISKPYKNINKLSDRGARDLKSDSMNDTAFASELSVRKETFCESGENRVRPNLRLFTETGVPAMCRALAGKAIQAPPPPAEKRRKIHADQRYDYGLFSFCFP
jgi:hypothetical protein